MSATGPAMAAPPDGERWELRAVCQGNPIEAWRDMQARDFLPFEVRPEYERGETFDARHVRRRVGAMSIVDYQCGRARGRRGPRQIASTETDMIGILLMRHGRLGLTLDGRSMVVTAGEAVIWDSVREGSWVALTPIAKRTLILPRELLRAAFPHLERVLSQPLQAGAPAVRLLSDYVDTLVRMGRALVGNAESAAVEGALALARGALAGELPEPQDLRTALGLQVPQYIETHLADPELSLSTIAHAHAVSVRTLHEAFRHTGETPGALIRRRRLERCHAELSQPGTGPITQIALRWGFRDSSTFSRAFRAHFGVSAREVRAATLN